MFCYEIDFFFPAEGRVRVFWLSRGVGDVYKGQADTFLTVRLIKLGIVGVDPVMNAVMAHTHTCLLYTSDAADDLPCVDLGVSRIFKKKNH